MDVVVVGSCMTDLVSTVPRLPKVGETLHGDSFAVGFGGKGANQCVMAAKLGAKAAMVAKVGDDTFGHNTIRNFKENSINIDHVGVTNEASSGVATISVTEAGENSIIIVAGANLRLTEQDVLSAESLIASSKVLICQLEIDPRTSLFALELAKKHGVTTVLNPAPAVAELDPKFYTNSDIICLNESEAEILTGHIVRTKDDAWTTALVLLDRGCQTVIVTLGASGAVIASKSDREAVVHIPTRSVTAVDTTGAGDAFIGALAFYLSRPSPLTLPTIIQRANEIATRTVLARGTQSSFMSFKELPNELFS